MQNGRCREVASTATGFRNGTPGRVVASQGCSFFGSLGGGGGDDGDDDDDAFAGGGGRGYGIPGDEDPITGAHVAQAKAHMEESIH